MSSIPISDIVKNYKLDSVKDLNGWCQTNKSLNNGQSCTLNKTIHKVTETKIGNNISKDVYHIDKGTKFINKNGKIVVQYPSAGKSKFGASSTPNYIVLALIAFAIYFFFIKKKSGSSSFGKRRRRIR